jgi:hypothetical protein
MNLLNLYDNNTTAYRGASYDPHAKKETEVKIFTETYRGCKHEEKVEVVK